MLIEIPSPCLTEECRFGFVISNLGDMDNDGKEDFAVGAPMGGKNEAGAVFVFHGCTDFKFGKEKLSEAIRELTFSTF